MMRDQIFKAIDIADSGELKTLLDHDPTLASSKSNDGLSAVLFCMYIGKPDLADIILEYKPELDLYDLSALGGVGQISALLATDQKAIHEYSGDGFTGLHVACYFGQADVAKLLLENGADVNKIAMNGTDLRPLQSAVAGCHVDVVRVLLDFKPDLNVRMLGGFTPLMSAHALGDEEIIRMLMGHGADPDLKADDGRIAHDFSLLSGNI